MNKKKQTRSAVLPLVRVTPAEKKQIQKASVASPFANQSSFIRAKLLEKERQLDKIEAFNEVILMGKIADLLNILGGEIVNIIKLRKQEGSMKMSKKERQLFKEVLKKIQEAQSEFIKKEEI